MWFWFWTFCSVALVVYGALWWTRRLMAWGDAMLPTHIRSQAEFDAVFGSPGMSKLSQDIEAYRDDLATPCFACGHLPVFHLDPKSHCECCTQSELIDLEID